jgi:hypothetical protein
VKTSKNFTLTLHHRFEFSLQVELKPINLFPHQYFILQLFEMNHLTAALRQFCFYRVL